MIPTRIIRLRADAPALPPYGSACTGCGLCCAWAPCPVGVVISRRWRGRCRALVWQTDRYVCRALAQPERVWPWLPRAALPLVRRWLRRAIAAGAGCDAHLEALRP